MNEIDIHDGEANVHYGEADALDGNALDGDAHDDGEANAHAGEDDAYDGEADPNDGEADAQNGEADAHNGEAHNNIIVIFFPPVDPDRHNRPLRDTEYETHMESYSEEVLRYYEQEAEATYQK